MIQKNLFTKPAHGHRKQTCSPSVNGGVLGGRVDKLGVWN